MKPIIILGLLLAAVSAGVSKTVRDGSHGSGKKMVCYYGTWAVYRPGKGKFDVESIDPTVCTHFIYGFAKLSDNRIKSYDPWQDLYESWGKGGFKRFTALKEKNPSAKFLIAIGGWNEGSEKYSDMASSPITRKMFVDSVKPFLDSYGFDGLDLDWEYPSTRGGKPYDKENFAALVSELRKELGSQYLLTAAVSPNDKTVDTAYDVPSIARDLDFINVMCYDYHGAWDGHTYTGHNTPLYRSPLDENFEPTFNVNDTVHYWLQAGLPKEKLILGMALYGRGFTLNKESEHGLYAPANSGIPQGPYTRQAGIWGYNEICEVFKAQGNQWTLVIDSDIKAPYGYSGRNWIGYEDVESLYYKSVYARELDLGGAMVWSIETDDFRGECHGQPYILINTIWNTINGGGKPTIPDRPPVVQSNEIIQGGDGSTSRPVPPTQPPPPPTPAGPIEECSEEGIFPSKGNCAAYVTCVRRDNGFTQYVQSCPSGLAYDPKSKGCNYASAVPGCEGKVGREGLLYKSEGF